jgi:DNA-binding MarR family transcriptional regulator/N-acetylglutamate synthase-like GNAT family acetyltransferase
MDAEREPSQIDDVRRFNRFYTKHLGLLRRGIHDTPFTLSEARVLYELAQRGDATASDVADVLGMDAGYLSRLLKRFDARRLITRRTATEDGRRIRLALAERGRKAFRDLDAMSHRQVESVLEALSARDRHRLTNAMAVIERILSAASDEAGAPYHLRCHRHGDLGWMVERHGAVYAQEYGWNHEFEALAAEVAATFLRNFDASRERSWIAERTGERAGCVLLIQRPGRPGVAQLRCLFVEPWARGLGIGRRLVGECTAFARQVGYTRIVLWTNSVLVSARRLYEAEGYVLVNEEPHHSFGADLVGQTWELEL